MAVIANEGLAPRCHRAAVDWLLEAARPDARVMLLSRCGHWVMVEHPALFNRMTIDFLAEPEPAR